MCRAALLEHGSRSLIAFPRIGWPSPVTETFLIVSRKLARSPLAGWLAGCRLFAILPPLREPFAAKFRSGRKDSGNCWRRLENSGNMASRRLDKRREVEAAEALGVDGNAEKDGKRKRAVAGAKKKPVKKKPRTKPIERRRIVWVIYNNTQKEEDRFPYDQKKAAEERIEALRSKSKRLYWLQAVKEALGAAPAGATTDIYKENYVPEIEVEEEAEVEAEVELEEDDEEEEEEEEDDDE